MCLRAGLHLSVFKEKGEKGRQCCRNISEIGRLHLDKTKIPLKAQG